MQKHETYREIEACKRSYLATIVQGFLEAAETKYSCETKLSTEDCIVLISAPNGTNLRITSITPYEYDSVIVRIEEEGVRGYREHHIYDVVSCHEVLDSYLDADLDI